MEKAKHGFSPQYLKQVHEEWLYVQSAEARRLPVGSSSEHDEQHYAFHFVVAPEGSQIRGL